MAVAPLNPRSLMQGAPPELDAFFRFYGTACSIPSVSRVGLGPTSEVIDVWVRLNRDHEGDQDTLYGALQRYRAGGDDIFVDLHVVFPDEDDIVWPASVRTLFERE
jgi:hypothetical protein